MQSTDQLDFSNPEHVSVHCKGNKLTVYISGINSSVRLTYQLQDESAYPKYLADNLPCDFKDALPIPFPPLQQT